MIDAHGQLVVARPPPQPTTLAQYLGFFVLLPVVAPVFITVKSLTDWSFARATRSLFSLVRGATARPVSTEWYFQDKQLLQRLWKLPSARAYVDEDTGEPLLEYQTKEGYCGSATQRCILRSFGLSNEKLPPQKPEPVNAEPWCGHIAQIARECSDDKVELSTKIVRGDVSYDEFVSALREGLAKENVRIACNYLRSALTGVDRYYPTHLLLGMYGGHFSPILGIVEGDGSENAHEGNEYPFVAIFDTNAKYNGTYLVPARRLYEAVRSIDVMANTHRAILLVEKKKP
ncbi:hypothetical protein ACHAXT_012635 [Thalassiosira profunda]